MSRYIDLDAAIQRVSEIDLAGVRNNLVCEQNVEIIVDWLKSLPVVDIAMEEPDAAEL
jgi:hypothetical protein